MEIQNKRIPDGEFEALRQEVLTQWPTGKDVDIDEAVAYHKAMPESRNFGKKLLAAKADVREELDRLRAHGSAARDLLAAGGPIGRRIDFLAQEFGREANTLCAKAGEIGLSRIGLDLKAVVEQFREQVQNIE